MGKKAGMPTTVSGEPPSRLPLYNAYPALFIDSCFRPIDQPR